VVGIADDRLVGMCAPASALGDDAGRSCRHGDRGRLLHVERVASHPTAADARAYLGSWIEFNCTPGPWTVEVEAQESDA